MSHTFPKNVNGVQMYVHYVHQQLLHILVVNVIPPFPCAPVEFSMI